MAKTSMAQPKLTTQEKKWRAEDDARILAESQVIMGDPKRLTAAAKAAKEMATKRQEEAKAMNKIAAKKPKGGQ